jgi:hypothetical protein
MTTISDPELMAYADGVLPRHRRPRVRQALLRDPELLEKLESYIITNRGLAAPFDRLPPMPNRLQRVLSAPAAAPREGWWGPLLRSLNEVCRGDGVRLPAWSVAAVALIAAAALAWQLMTARPSASQLAALDAKGLMMSAPFQRALESTESNVAAQLASLKPIGTFLSAQNEWCRQYELVRDGSVPVAGVACRDQNGEWQVKTSALIATAPQGNGYSAASKEPAGGEGADRLDSVIGKLMLGVVLLPPDEKRLIAGGWQPPR